MIKPVALPAVLAVLLLAAGCRDTSRRTPVDAAGHSPSRTTTTSSPALAGRAPHTGAAAILDQLAVTPEDTGAHYRRDEWSTGWDTHPDSQPPGCTTRQLVLLRQAPTAKAGKRCAPYCPATVTEKCWTSPYDNQPTRNPADLQVDHIVPLKESNRSRVRGSGPAGDPEVGAGRVWSTADKHRFAQDMENLIAVTGSLNQTKGDLDPGRWKPPNRDHWCAYGRAYTHIKVKYSLSVDEAELVGLEQLLGTCRD